MRALAFEDLSTTTNERAIEIGQTISDIVQAPRALQMLRGRLLNGVIRRHQDEERSIGAIFRARNSEDGSKSFAILDSESNRAIGLASAIPNLELWRQRIIGPTRVMRKLGNIGVPTSILETRIPDDSFNIAAWVRPHDVETEFCEIQSAYSKLLEEVDQAWTISPDNEDLWYATLAIGATGIPHVATDRFDDLEAV
ncbi:MAG: hypothetical protein QG628_176, partial [Patescibacteria group bacterium]|nr:hypothetical protein [Patescibacteria group bacterium]